MSDLLPTTVVGNYPQPNWLIDRDNLRSRLPPRVRARSSMPVGMLDIVTYAEIAASGRLGG